MLDSQVIASYLSLKKLTHPLRTLLAFVFLYYSFIQFFLCAFVTDETDTEKCSLSKFADLFLML